MNYFLFKLQFDTAVHFGSSDSALSLYTSEETLRADTLFSALCHEILAQHGETSLLQLCEEVRQGKFLLSDLMPYHDETFYLPKPIAPSESTEEVETFMPATLTRAKKAAKCAPASAPILSRPKPLYRHRGMRGPIRSGCSGLRRTVGCISSSDVPRSGRPKRWNIC